MNLLEQAVSSKRTGDFVRQYGLKKQFVAMKCGVPEAVFSKFLNGRGVLSENQLQRVNCFVSEYIKRNG